MKVSSSLSIRYADLNDINAIGFLAQQIWPLAYKSILSEDQLNYMLNLFYSPAALKYQMIDQKHIFIMVEEEEHSLGFASYSNTNESGIFKLHKIYVMPDQQGKGLGKAIIDFIENDIRYKNAHALRLNVNRNNIAKKFYEHLGFAVIGEEDIDIGNHYFMNDYVMEKKLE